MPKELLINRRYFGGFRSTLNPEVIGVATTDIPGQEIEDAILLFNWRDITLKVKLKRHN